ncbi:hypothetical protein [Flavobacterium tructae]|uniref:Uncharacterized protein n=1 Tax=Flavobacterium tructae TaxID=1114873 RepID=A0A1S1J0T3_9FLAO|nr:hypothetical protein [Flavobacterium tructae]OHT43410.1 hypothetical protein BHE19_19170 [Flavobacterium tructae]OXB19712.1 hypothetical protein B0A71_09685 [Flavobacterium tructae]OXB23863.1 hypothetical protein B0A80_09395 [Flavobacterium tructae]
MKKIVLLMIAFNLINACQKPKDNNNYHYSIKVKNNTNKVLYIYRGFDSVMPLGDFRSDPYFKTTAAFAGNGNIEIGEIRFTGGGRPTCIEDILHVDERLYIYVFDSAFIANKKWDEILKDSLVDGRLEVTIDELIKNSFTINYNKK